MRLSDEGNSSKIEDVELVPAGMELCTLYSIVDLGTQSTNFGDKPQLRLLFEFPQHMRVFYEGSDERPSVISATETKSLAPKANLRKKFIEPMLGRGLGEKEAKDFNPEVLVGMHFVATVIHSPDGKWANIGSIMPLNQKTMTMFGLTEPKINQINESLLFDIEDDGFMSEKFGKLPNNLRSKIMDSTEGQAHKAAGGKFHEPIRNNDNNSQGGNASQGGAGKKLVMNPDSPYSYEQLKGADWTDQQIVDNGHGKWQVATPPPAPQAAPTPPPAPAPAPAPAPQAPAPQAPQAQSAPTPPPAAPQAPQGVPQAPPAAPKQHPIKMRNPDLQGKIDDYLKQGWTYEALVENSIADFIQE